MKKILFIADSIKRKTGYSTVVRNIISKLVDTNKYDIGLLGLADVPALVDLPITYYTQIKDHTECCARDYVIEFKTKNEPTIKYIKLDSNNLIHENQSLCLKGTVESSDTYAYDSVYFVIQHFKPDIVIPINDIWGLYNINYIKNRSCFKLIPYMAIDSECMFPGLEIPVKKKGLPSINTVETINKCDKVIVFTDWAKGVLNKVSETITKTKFDNINVIPHGVDTSIWKPLDVSKQELKKKFFNKDSDFFLVGVIGRNQPRKRLDAAIITLNKFINNYEKPNRPIYMYFHCSINDEIGWPLMWLANYYGVLDRCIFDKRLKPGIGPNDAQLNELVNSFDAHLLLTNSEGWCLPVLESAAAGIPNIVTKYSAHADWGKDTLMFCKVAEYEHEPKTGFIKAIADTKDAAKQLSLLYNSKQLCKDYSDKGIKLGKKLDWNKVTKEWELFIDSIDISDFKEDRYETNLINLKTTKHQDMSLTIFPDKM